MNVVITGTDHPNGLGHQLKRAFEIYGDHVIGSTFSQPATEHDPHLDLTDDETINTYVHHIANHMDKVDVLVHNAGTTDIVVFDEVDRHELNRVMQTNCLGPIMLTQRMLPWMQVDGIVVFILSDAAYRPMRCSLAYNISKAATHMAVRQLARELSKPFQLSIFGVCPGPIAHTPLLNLVKQEVCRVRGWTPEEADAYAESQSVTGLEVSSIDLAHTLADLFRSPTARHLSGACMEFTG